MQINVRYLDNLKLEAQFDDFTIIADQPVRYKGDGTAPGPFDYFLASSAMCAAYFVKVYCNTRNISTNDIKITQNNIVDPDNRYKQAFKIEIELPQEISEKDRKGIIASMERCSVKRVIQNEIDFIIQEKQEKNEKDESQNEFYQNETTQTYIAGKDLPLEESIKKMTSLLKERGIEIEIASWRNPIPNIWSVHIRDADSPMCYTNGKGASKNAALASALGEFIERASTNYFFSDYYLGADIANSDFVHYPHEKWFSIPDDDSIPVGLMDSYMLEIYNPDNELTATHLIDSNSGNFNRGICALPFTRQSDGEVVYIPVNVLENLYVSNGMSAGNTLYEARVQSLSEIFERAIKNEIIKEEITLPDVPLKVLQRYPNIYEAILKLESEGFPILVKDASLGGLYPVMCVTLLNPKTGGVFASFGAHPSFEIALERALTELLQGRSFQGMDEMPAPTFSEHAIKEHNNIIDHFIDSTGVVSWKFFSSISDYEFKDWNFNGDTQDEYHYLMDILTKLEKEVYIADYPHLGTYACRIIVPDFSEIYLPEDLIWDNSNLALEFREDILNLHILKDHELEDLLERLEESDKDDYTLISELIGVAFEEASCWGRLSICELKCLIHLALKNFDEAKSYCQQLITFNDNTLSRRKFFQVLDVMLDITLLDLEFDDYKFNLQRMYGEKLVTDVIGCIMGENRFFGLTPTCLNLSGIEKHNKLIESFRKLQAY